MPVLLSAASFAVKLYTERVRTQGANPVPREPSWAGSSFLGTVGAVQAMGISAVFACMNAISGNIAQLPVHVFQKRRDGSSEQISPASLNYLTIKPNPEVDNFVFWQTVFNHKVLTGNAYIFVQKNQLGLPMAMWPIEPERVRVGREPSSPRRKVYLIDNETPMLDYVIGGEILHIMGTSWDGMVGLSPIKLAAQTLVFSSAAQTYASTLLANPGAPGGLLSTEADLPDDVAESLAARWDRRHGGTMAGKTTAVLSNGTKWQQTTISPVDAQLIESMQWGVTEWARWFGVPPHLIQDITKQSSWGTGIAEQKQGFLSGTLTSHFMPAEQAVTNSLLGGGSRYMRFNTGGWLRGSIKEQYEVTRIGLGNQPFLTQDEGRAYLELPPMGGKAAELGVAVGGAPPEKPQTTPNEGATPPNEAPKSLEETETQRMARAFLDGASYGKIAIDFAMQGVDPAEAVKKRITRHFNGEMGIPPQEARKQVG